MNECDHWSCKRLERQRNLTPEPVAARLHRINHNVCAVHPHSQTPWLCSPSFEHCIAESLGEPNLGLEYGWCRQLLRFDNERLGCAVQFPGQCTAPTAVLLLPTRQHMLKSPIESDPTLPFHTQRLPPWAASPGRVPGQTASLAAPSPPRLCLQTAGTLHRTPSRAPY